MEIQNGVAKTKQQIADEYVICIKTFDRLLKRKQIKLYKGLFPRDQLIIYNKLGIPKSIRKFHNIPKSSI